MFTEEVFDEVWNAADVYFSDDSTLVIGGYGGGCIKSQLSVERYFERHCGSFNVEVDFEEDGLRVAWGFDGTTLRDRNVVIPKESEPLAQLMVRMIDGILERYGHPDAPQPVEELDIARLMEYIADRWNRLLGSDITLDKGKGVDGLTWLGKDQLEVLSLVPAEVRGKWQINAMAYYIDTFDWSDVDMSQSIYEMAQAVADRPRVPTITTFTFRDQGTANQNVHAYWLREAHEELWDTVEANLEMYTDRSL